MCFCFINQPGTIFIAFDKYFYNCGAIVEKYFYITFLIHEEKFAFQVHA